MIGERAPGLEEHLSADARQQARVKGHEEGTIADAADQRLRSDAAQLVAAVVCPGTDNAAVARGYTATRPAIVPSDLLDRSVATNR